MFYQQLLDNAAMFRSVDSDIAADKYSVDDARELPTWQLGVAKRLRFVPPSLNSSSARNGDSSTCFNTRYPGTRLVFQIRFGICMCSTCDKNARCLETVRPNNENIPQFLRN